MNEQNYIDNRHEHTFFKNMEKKMENYTFSHFDVSVFGFGFKLAGKLYLNNYIHLKGFKFILAKSFYPCAFIKVIKRNMSNCSIIMSLVQKPFLKNILFLFYVQYQNVK